VFKRQTLNQAAVISWSTPPRLAMMVGVAVLRLQPCDVSGKCHCGKMEHLYNLTA
jgi:hypothetical protein